MKKLYVVCFAMLLGFIHCTAQGIYQFWGIAEEGGSDNQGVLFSSKYDGTGVRTHNAFEIETPGASPSRNGLVYCNGRLYGVTPEAGQLNMGLIYEYNPATNTYTKKVDFYSIGGRYPQGSMVVFQNRLYGVVSAGVANNGYGMLYEYDPATNSLTVKHYFQDGNGENPAAGLVLYNNKLYGTGGGADGEIFSYDPVNNVYAKLAELNSTVGHSVHSPLLPYNNRLYGVGFGGGLLDDGTLFEFNPVTNTVVKKADMNTIDAEGPMGGLVLFNNKLYGGTRAKGANGDGVIYEYNPAQNTLVKKIDLSETNGSTISTEMLLYNNKLYGVTLLGGSSSEGVLFEYDPATNTYLKKVNFSGLSMGKYPHATLVLLNDKFYGVTNQGGLRGFGTLFEYNPAANGIIKKKDFKVVNDGYEPLGKLTYYSGKLYGITAKGGANDWGTIFSYDLATGTYVVRYNMAEATGRIDNQGGMLLYNNKLYGVTRYGNGGDGVLYEFDPLNDNYTVKHYFSEATGKQPTGVPVFYNNKLYGTTTLGGSNGAGVLYEYDPATNTYTVRVHFGGSFGRIPEATLTLHNGRLYGTCNAGGTNDKGTLFEYIPAGNGFIKRFDFSTETGWRPSGTIAVFNNKLYGTTVYEGGAGVDGVLYEYDLATNAYTQKHQFKMPGGISPNGGTILHNNKLYGVASNGASQIYGGALYEYNPALNTYNEQTIFTSLNGYRPTTTHLITVPALVAPGTPGSCSNIGITPITAANAGQWVPFTDEGGNAVLEINANGNVLGNVTVQFYTHNGATRKDAAGRFYLDRNITITVDNQPVTPVSIRFYIRKTEFESLKNTAGSGILNVSDITPFKSSAACSNSVGGTALPLTSGATTWGLDYVYTAQVSSFSTFYFASKAYSALPVKLEYFKGVAEATANRLHWNASCTENTDFIVERSTDGVHFSQIGIVLATVTDCGKPFQFPDQHPVPGKTYYRLQMKESNGAITYSSIITLEREQGQALSIQLTLNPVAGPDAIFTVYSPGSKTIPIAIYDATGRLMMRAQWQVQPGSQVRRINMQQAPAGIYHVVFQGTEKVQPVRLMRQ
ncbi:hypothetical protein HB364_10255 [Pseudoflavitalea sp. X16]|uniref:choice-of-anchor tandem repeat GloVer-containing protein n=1 Tax=Paraflavitalea devenefica TaxID=2716334 RepID=UPI00142058FA|nr:choice-of-anchor tandem repeat GloVer-containing protein [Paraflavitalea devenefica]NII25465.1 hypothetical protein [Paraflavitalea devenefica]